MARDLDAEWFAVSVSLPRQIVLPIEDQQRLEKHLQLAQSLGAQVAVISSNRVADAILDFARRHNVNMVLVGPPLRPAWQELLFGSVVYQLIRRSQGIHIMVLGSDVAPSSLKLRLPTLEKLTPLSLVKSAILVGLWTLFLELLNNWLTLSAQVLLMLIPVFLSAFLWGEISGIAATLLALVFIDWLFVPPRWSFHLSDLLLLPTLLAFAGMGGTFSLLLGLLRRWERRVRQREYTMALLYQFSHRLIETGDVVTKLRFFLTYLHTLLQRPIALFFPDHQGRITLWERTSDAPEISEHDRAVAAWVYDHRQPAGVGTTTLASVPWYFFPLVGEKRSIGVVAVYSPGGSLSMEELMLVEPMARMAALAIEDL
jgi:two-component system sensor histidine kinase KdpD